MKNYYILLDEKEKVICFCFDEALIKFLAKKFNYHYIKLESRNKISKLLWKFHILNLSFKKDQYSFSLIDDSKNIYICSLDHNIIDFLSLNLMENLKLTKDFRFYDLVVKSLVEFKNFKQFINIEYEL